jgi:2-dehydropantoate 2-reductase
VAVKTWQVAEVAPRLRPLLGAETAVIPLENGVEASDTLARELGEGAVANGVIAVMASIAAPGAVRHVGFTPKVTLGERRKGRSERLARLCEALKKAGVDASAVDDVAVPLWQKFLFIDPFGSVAAATRSPAGTFREVPEARALLAAAMREVEALARARGVALPPGAVDQALATVDSFPPEATASMQRDIQGGRPSELFEQTGAVLRLGKAAGVATPVHETLFACLLPQERRARQGAKG